MNKFRTKWTCQLEVLEGHKTRREICRNCRMPMLLWTQKQGSKEDSGNWTWCSSNFTQLVTHSFPTGVLAKEHPLFDNDKDHIQMKQITSRGKVTGRLANWTLGNYLQRSFLSDLITDKSNIMRKIISVCKKDYLDHVGLRELLDIFNLLSFSLTLVKVNEDNELCACIFLFASTVVSLAPIPVMKP